MGLSEFLRKTFVSQTSRVKESGQAVIEYLLVLFITVALVLGLMYQFNDAFKQFLDTYFGDYIACLLETGELPSLGGTGPNQGQCVTPFGDFNIAAGASQINPSSNSSGGAGSDSNSSSSNNSGSSDSSGGSRGNQSLRRSRVSSSGAPGNGETTGSGRATPGRPARVQQSSLNNSSNQGGFDSKSAEGRSGGGRGQTRRRKRIIYLGENYMSKEAKEKKDQAVLGKAKAKKDASGAGSLRKPTMALAVPEPKKMSISSSDSGMSFGNFIKFLIIAGIVIAIVLLLGGQAMQIKKSWQKSD